MDDRHFDLIQREIDGLNTPEEHAELQAFLDANTEAKTLYDDLAATVRLLEKVESREPPPRLKHNIMAALPVDRYAPARPSERFGWLKALRAALPAKPRFAYAYAFAAGLVVGLALFGVLEKVVPDSSNDVYGTLVSKEAPAALEPVEEVAIDVEDARGTVRVQAVDGEVVVELALEAQQPVEVRLAFEDHAGLASGIRFQLLRDGAVRLEETLATRK